MKNFEIISRAVILKDSKILLCRNKKDSYYYLPGGHVEFGEKAEGALAREINEEFGIGIKSAEYIGAVENIFIQAGQRHHEFNLIFLTAPQSLEISPVERGLKVEWVGFEKAEFLPKVLMTALRKWKDDHKQFWTSQL